MGEAGQEGATRAGWKGWGTLVALKLRLGDACSP